MSRRYQAVLFDLLTALLDSWTVWDRAAGSSERGRAWRAEYLRLTYGCGAYRPYETLVMEAAQATGMDEGAPARLEAAWETLMPWPAVTGTLAALKATHRLGVVTNCSERLGHIAAARVGVSFDVVVTSERAGFYKPDPRPYQLALADLGLPASRVLFVAGSGYDLFGTAACALDTYWHNRIGLAAPAGAPAPLVMAADLAGLQALAQSA
jgi:2-haloalkanoic acid dehalogenase type II